MKLRLLPLKEQVMVVTGASSGIGLVTARKAARRGACVVLASRNERDLASAAAEIRRTGGKAIHVVADVSDPDQVEHIADEALAEFGRVDTWVNNAAVSMYGRVTELKLADMRRQMDVNFWGQVYGSRTAVRHLRARGGALINIGSVVSDRAIPLQSIYCAAKHAVKGFTDSLRMELEEEGAPISVTLVKPASIDTPFFDKARSYLGVEPQPVSPVYAPELVAEVVLDAAQRPVRERIVGGGGLVLSAARFTPGLADTLMERTAFDAQSTDKPLNGRSDNLYHPLPDDGGERGANWTGHTRRYSVYTGAMLHPALAAAAVGGLAMLAAVARSRE